MNDIKEIFSLLDYLEDNDRDLLKRAYVFAQDAHLGQLRKSGEPYFNHVFATAKNIAELHMSATVIAAGFLHDTLEDTKILPADILREFGEEILFLVESVTKLGEIRYKGTERYNESLRKLFVAMSQDIRVLIIKLCDRLHNIQTLKYVSKEKQLRIATETLEIYAPIAYRLGIKKLQRDLEDLSFPFVYPEKYLETKKIMGAKRESVEKELDKFEKLLKKELAQNGVTKFRMDHRVKSIYSLFKKLEKYKGDVEAIYDVSALRVIVPELTDCYRVLGIVHSSWRPLPERIKDYIASPKLNGYRSIHTTIFTGDGDIIEVQIRTEEMHKECEFGIASHISYKAGSKKGANPNMTWLKKILPRTNLLGVEGKTRKSTTTSDVPEWIRELVEYQNEAGDEFVDNIKSDFFEERIFVFTPKGDVIDLPKDSSVIDFAYAIHTDIGDHISSAKINGKFMAIHTTLKNGDRVEIETKKSSKPSRKWMEFCKTTMARRRIMNYLEPK